MTTERWSSPYPRGCGYCDADLLSQESYNTGFCSVAHKHLFESDGPRWTIAKPVLAKKVK